MTREKPKARGLAFIGVLPCLARGEGWGYRVMICTACIMYWMLQKACHSGVLPPTVASNRQLLLSLHHNSNQNSQKSTGIGALVSPCRKFTDKADQPRTPSLPVSSLIVISIEKEGRGSQIESIACFSILGGGGGGVGGWF